MFGMHGNLDEELETWRVWALDLFGFGPEAAEAPDNTDLREALGRLIATARTERTWQEIKPSQPGLYWFKGSHLAGDVLFLQPTPVEVTGTHEVRVPGRVHHYRVSEFTGHWCGPFVHPA